MKWQKNQHECLKINQCTDDGIWNNLFLSPLTFPLASLEFLSYSAEISWNASDVLFLVRFLTNNHEKHKKP